MIVSQYWEVCSPCPMGSRPLREGCQTERMTLIWHPTSMYLCAKSKSCTVSVQNSMLENVLPSILLSIFSSLLPLIVYKSDSAFIPHWTKYVHDSLVLSCITNSIHCYIVYMYAFHTYCSICTIHRYIFICRQSKERQERSKYNDWHYNWAGQKSTNALTFCS